MQPSGRAWRELGSARSRSRLALHRVTLGVYLTLSWSASRLACTTYSSLDLRGTDRAAASQAAGQGGQAGEAGDADQGGQPQQGGQAGQRSTMDSGGDRAGIGGEGAANAGEGGAAGAPAVPSRFQQDIRGGGTQNGFHTFLLLVDGKSYNVQTNPWGGAVQTVTAGGSAIFRVDVMEEPPGKNAWDVAAFPAVYVGVAHAGANPTVGSGLPASIGRLSSVRTGLSTNASTIPYRGATTYDLYFTHTEQYNSGAPDVHLMVWFDARTINALELEGEGGGAGAGEGASCGAEIPSYFDVCSVVGVLSVADKTFYRLLGKNATTTLVTYVPEAPMDEWEFDLKPFLDDATTGGALTEAMFLQSIQAGFELASGGAGLTVKGFYADVE